MIETERQRQAAVSWIRYWKASIAAGEQSWLAQEQAQETMMALHTQVDAYDKRVHAPSVDPLSDSVPAAGHGVAAPERESRSKLREEEPMLSPSSPAPQAVADPGISPAVQPAPD